MKEYNDKIDYCGPGRGWLTKIIPRKIGGVDINYHCYIHDSDYATKDRRKAADKVFRNSIKREFQEKGKPVLGWIVSWTYYIAVRLGGWMV